MKTAIPTLSRAILFIAALFSCSAYAQGVLAFDTSGTGQLNGTYYFREVYYVIADNSGDLNDAGSLFGTITFNGTGQYTINATNVDGASGTGSGSSTGTYSVAASGLGTISSPISSGDSIYGILSNGVFIGSTTENASGFNDLFIAVPVNSSASNSTLNGTYWVADMDFPDGTVTDNRDSWFQLTADGQGNISPINVQGYIASSGSTVTQTISGAHYSFSNEAANVTLGGSLTTSNLIAGNKILYISPDGNLVFGGAPDGWDMFVGVRVSSGAGTNSTFNGLYYQGGIIEDNSQGFGNLETFYGSLAATNGSIIDNKRILTVFNNAAINATTADSYNLTSSGTYDAPDGSAHFAVGANGAVRVGVGVNPYMGIALAVQAPSFSGSGVYINPAGIVNAASSAPFTAGLSRGELITIYGTNLAPSLAVASTLPFPQILNGVQVNINNRPAPIYYVSQNQVSVIVPYETELSFAQIQIINNTVDSNIVTVYMDLTEPGVFTNNPVGGLGYAAALHPDYSLVSPSSPAQVNETISVYVTGLGDITPSVSDGAAGPTSLTSTINPITVYVDNVAATVSYAGLAPGLAGLYQINVTIPSGVSNGDVYLTVAGPDSYSSESIITVGTATASARPAAAGRAKLPKSTPTIKRARKPLISAIH